ncbi:MAG: nuclear transport factor 2 family protein [bacterium]
MKQFRKHRIVIFTLIFLFVTASAHSQKDKPDKQPEADAGIKNEIKTALEKWNDAAKSRNLKQFMELYDNSPDIMLVGSDSGEIFMGREQIENWATKLLSFASFSWDMKRIDIDANGNTAWVFMDGFMVVTNDKGKTRKLPYRFTGILVKVNNTWKWRLFSGSAPGSH